MRRFWQGALALLVAGSVTVAGADQVVQAQTPDPSAIIVQSISYVGSGCPQGSVGMSFANDRESFTLIFDSFVASAGPSVPRSEARKACQIQLMLKAPDGWSFAVLGLDARGYVQLPSGARAVSSLDFELDGRGRERDGGESDSARFSGQVATDYIFSADAPVHSRGWSRCGGTSTLEVNAGLKLERTPNDIGSQITLDSLDGELTQRTGHGHHGFRLGWRRCS